MMKKIKENFSPNVPYNDLPLLPPEKAQYETVNVWKKESEVRTAVGELKGIAQIIPNQTILINAVVLQEAKDSSEIENIITTQDKLYKAVSTKQKNIVDPSTKEVINYRKALYEGFDRIKRNGFLRVNDILDLQEIIVENNAGIRKTPGTALVNDKTGQTIYTPPNDEDVINKLLSNFIEYINNQDSSLIKMAIAHYQFETIHPFYDGNGRTGRIINILYIILKEYLDIPILYLSSFIINNKEEYYRFISNVTKQNAWEEWILYILNGIEITARETIGKIKKIKSLMDKTIENVKQNAGSIYSKELVETLFVHPYCKNKFIIDELKVERKAASRYLHKLEDIGILKSYKVGKENIYINIQLMQIL